MNQSFIDNECNECNEPLSLSTGSLQEPLLSQTAVTDGGEVSVRSEIHSVSESGQGDDGPTEKDISLQLCGKVYFMNHNVVLNLVLNICYGISDSIWGGTVFAAYLKILSGGRNEPVGTIEAVSGLAGLFSALPVGYVADRYGRSNIIKAGGVLIAFAAIFHISVLQWVGVDYHELSDGSVAFTLLAVVMAIWGIAGGIVNGPTQALYADSTPAGKRAVYYHYLYVCYLIASCCGPILSIILFQTLGDDWNLKDLRVVCYVGLGMAFFNSFIMMFFDDKKALNEGEEDAVPVERMAIEEQVVEQVKVSSPSSSTHSKKELSEIDDERNKGRIDGDFSDSPRTLLEEGCAPPISPEDLMMTQRRRWIPYITFAASLTFGIGSGMTVKFFPLFFKDDIGLTPTEVQFIYFSVPISLVIFSGAGTSLSRVIGRVQTTLIFYVAGILCLLSMVVFKDYLDNHPFVLVPIYVIRTSFMNGTYPLQESVLMDFVPKNERARWKSLESVAAFGWCGSAVLGGIISDNSDYTHTFLVTAIIQSSGLLCYACLLPLVPMKESALAL